MEQLIFVFPHPGVEQIKSLFRTLQGYIRASLALHNRPTESVYQVARVLGDMVDLVEVDWEGDPDVARMATKFRELVRENGLNEIRPTD